MATKYISVTFHHSHGDQATARMIASDPVPWRPGETRRKTAEQADEIRTHFASHLDGPEPWFTFKADVQSNAKPKAAKRRVRKAAPKPKPAPAAKDVVVPQPEPSKDEII